MASSITWRIAVIGAAALAGSLALGAGAPSNAPAATETRAPEKEYATSWEQYSALLTAAHGGAKLKWDKMPDWSGVWARQGIKVFSFDETQPSRTDLPMYPQAWPQLTPKYRAAYEQKIEDIKQHKEWDRLSWCLPAGFPRWLAEPWLREFIVTPNQTWMTHEQVNETRRIYTDGRAHVPDADAVPLWLGDSIGFWNGDTLTVHTTHLKAGQYQRGNPDYSFHISTVEQVRLVSPGLLEDRITVYDPDSLTKPFHAVFHYRKLPPDVRVDYASCEENNNTYLGENGQANERVPGEKDFRDSRTFGIPPVAFDSIPK